MKFIFLTILSLNVLTANIDLNTQISRIYDIKDNKAKIDIPNLKIGQSGVVVHDSNGNKLILTQASVIKSNESHTVISFIKKEMLPQDAIPTSKLRPTKVDKFILNHLYKTSLLIVPNAKAKKDILDKYKSQRFINEDFFASYLKLINKPIPKKDDILLFTKDQQIGTIFVVVKNKLYILDAVSFKLIDTVEININDNKTEVPFLTKITEIEKGFWDFGDDNIKNYNKYYLKLLGIKQ